MAVWYGKTRSVGLIYIEFTDYEDSEGSVEDVVERPDEVKLLISN